MEIKIANNKVMMKEINWLRTYKGSSKLSLAIEPDNLIPTDNHSFAIFLYIFYIVNELKFSVFINKYNKAILNL